MRPAAVRLRSTPDPIRHSCPFSRMGSRTGPAPAPRTSLPSLTPISVALITSI